MNFRIVAIALCASAVQLFAPVGPTASARAADQMPATQPHPITKQKQVDGASIKELNPLNGAEKVRYDKGAYDSLHVAYGLKEKYPAQDVLGKIAERLKKLGWKPLKEDWLNPGTPSSHVSGWGEFVDGTVEPERQEHQWLAQWKNRAGDVVVYCFTYSYPRKGKPDLQALWVNGSWFPASGVAKMRAAIPK